MLSTHIAITVIYTCNMFVLFCACDVMNVLSVKKKMKIYKKKKKKRKKKKERNVHWTVIYKIFDSGADQKSNMAVRAHNVF